MATSTPNLGLIKPAPSENYNLNTYNQNLDTIDTLAKAPGTITKATPLNMTTGWDNYQPYYAVVDFGGSQWGYIQAAVIRNGTTYTLTPAPTYFSLGSLIPTALRSTNPDINTISKNAVVQGNGQNSDVQVMINVNPGSANGAGTIGIRTGGAGNVSLPNLAAIFFDFWYPLS